MGLFPGITGLNVLDAKATTMLTPAAATVKRCIIFSGEQLGMQSALITPQLQGEGNAHCYCAQGLLPTTFPMLPQATLSLA